MKRSRRQESEVKIRCPYCHAENPLGAQSCHVCAVRLSRGGMIVSGVNAKEVQEVSLALLEKTKSSHISPSPWASGSFYLIVFIVVIAALSVAGHVLPIIALPVVFIGGLLALSVIGAFQMRQDEKLSEENFLKLMALSFKYLPWLRRQKTEESKV